MNTHY